MKERLLQLLDLEQLTPSKFADIIGVQRSSVSHVISGRNNPSFDFLQKTLKAFPGLNAEWLILGKGSMYEQMGRRGTGTLFDEGTPSDDDNAEVEQSQLSEDKEDVVGLPDDQSELEGAGLSEGSGIIDKAVKSVTEGSDLAEGRAGKRITRVILLYEDDTFTSFDPS